MPVSFDRIFPVEITRATRTASRRGFGIAMLAAHHTRFPERARSYADPSEMLDDGFETTDAAYLAAVAFCSQSPRPPTFKIGRRLGTPDQTIRLTPGTPVEDEVFGITIGGVRFEVTADATPSVSEICDFLVALIQTDPDAIIATAASAVTAQTLSGASLDGVIGGGTIAPARNLTMTLNAHADWDASTAVVTGLDEDGRAQSEAFPIPNGGGVTLVGTRFWSHVDNQLIPAQTGTNGTLTLGVGELFADNPNLDITITDNTTHVDISADDTGAWFGYADATTNLTLDDITAEPATTLAVDLAGIAAADADWYALCLADGQSAAQILAAAAWMETEKRAYVAHTFDTDVEGASSDDVLSDLRDLSRLRTIGFYSRANAGRFPDAALLGRVLALDPGSWTAAFKSLSGVEPDDLSTTALDRIIGTTESPVSGKGGFVYVDARPAGTNRGTPIVLGGLTGDAEWLDIVQGLDFAAAELQARVFAPLLNNPKVPYTPAGIDVLAGGVRTAMRKLSRAPHLIFRDDFLVETPAFEDIDPADRQNRFFDGIVVDAGVQGAIHGGRIRFTVRP